MPPSPSSPLPWQRIERFDCPPSKQQAPSGILLVQQVLDQASQVWLQVSRPYLFWHWQMASDRCPTHHPRIPALPGPESLTTLLIALQSLKHMGNSPA